MDAAERTDVSAEDMTAADTAPSPKNATHWGHRYCMTMGKMSLFSSSGMGSTPTRDVAFQSVRLTKLFQNRYAIYRAEITILIIKISV